MIGKLPGLHHRCQEPPPADRATSISGSEIEILYGWQNESTLSSFMAYPYLVELGGFDNRRDVPPSHHAVATIRR